MDQRSTILAVDNLNGVKVLSRMIRVDHVHQYKLPKDLEKLDQDKRKLFEEGCAPKEIEAEESDEPEEEALIPHKKVKKEKRKKRRRHSTSSGTGSSEDDYHNDQGNSRKGRKDIKFKSGKPENGEKFRDQQNSRDHGNDKDRGLGEKSIASRKEFVEERGRNKDKSRGREYEGSRKTSYEKYREYERDSMKSKVDQQTSDKSLEERLKEMTDYVEAGQRKRTSAKDVFQNESSRLGKGRSRSRERARIRDKSRSRSKNRRRSRSKDERRYSRNNAETQRHKNRSRSRSSDKRERKRRYSSSSN